MTDTTPVSKSVAKRLAVQNPVPPVPSREAVDALLNCDYMSVPVRELQNLAKYLYAEVERLTDQLPKGMKNCTIIFQGCEKGHGWLTATNWVQRECLTCERDALRATVAEQGAALAAASHALRSYQYGNSATDLAEQAANACDIALASAQGLADPVQRANTVVGK